MSIRLWTAVATWAFLAAAIPSLAQTPAQKTNDDDLAKAKRQIAELDATVKNERATSLALRKDIDKLKRDLREVETLAKGNVVHTAFYRIKKGGTKKQIDAFVESTSRILGKLPGVIGLWVGRPSIRGTEQAEFDVGVVAIFEDADALRRFLDHPVQKRFSEAARRGFDPIEYNLLRE